MMDVAAIATQLDFSIRTATDSDRAFIADAWLNTIRAGTEETRRAEWDSFRSHHHARIDTILDDARTSVRIAAPAGDDVTIYGYMVFRPDEPVIHMLFVKKPFRRMGVATKLLGGHELDGVAFTQWSCMLTEWILPKLRKPYARNKYGQVIFKEGLRYNPWA